jgi:two-component system cell cycle sensor histidine kinase/response regulator CckA
MQSLAELHPDTFLSAVLDDVGVALVVVNEEGRFALTNQAALDILGHPGRLDGISLEEWRRDYVFRDDQGRPIPTELAPIVRALAGEQIPPQDIDVTLPDGRRKYLHAAGHPFSVFGVTGLFVIITDETEQIKLRRSLERAQNAETLGLVVQGLAHDLKNMISVISGNVALIQADECVAETAQTRLKQITLALERGSSLATRLARHSQAQELQPRPAQINELVNVALELVNPLLKKRVRVKTELGSLPAVEVDVPRMEQVLVNLILNALDAMPEGGELTLRTEMVERAAATGIELVNGEGKRATSFVSITVADTGIGIPEKLQSYIFDPFFTTKPVGTGSGIGLTSAYAVVRQHGGNITVQSGPSGGAKFTIYLPVEEKASTSAGRDA